MRRLARWFAWLGYWSRQLGYRPTARDLTIAAMRYADATATLAMSSYAQAAGVSQASADAQAFRSHYWAAMLDAYQVGAREAIAMSRGDFTPEPWTD